MQPTVVDVKDFCIRFCSDRCSDEFYSSSDEVESIPFENPNCINYSLACADMCQELCSDPVYQKIPDLLRSPIEATRRVREVMESQGPRCFDFKGEPVEEHEPYFPYDPYDQRSTLEEETFDPGWIGIGLGVLIGAGAFIITKHPGLSWSLGKSVAASIAAFFGVQAFSSS